VGSKRIRQTGKPSFPYAKSVIIAWCLIVAAMSAAAALSDPKSGQLRHPLLSWSILAALPIAIPLVFLVESKRKNRGRRPNSDHEL
jgi:hypothetical protein